MIKLFITGLLLTGLYGLAMGQREIPAAEKTPVFLPDKAYSLGINSQFAIDGFLDPETLTPIEFLLRRGLPGDRSLRLRASGWVENTNKIEGEENLKIQQSRFAIALGHEWHHHINNKLGYYFGADLEKGWDIHNTSRNYSDFSETYGDLKVRRYDFNTTQSLGLVPLVGFTYSPLSYLILSYEIRMKIFYYRTKFRSDSYTSQVINPDECCGHSIGGYDAEAWIFDFQPYSGIFINLKF
ncbi:hypothetical protein [Cyclobacterium marinum]|uniref:hypothetical protein n=1 Tax=Cyclobacterium marinum TaxID=104 RepID=UPI0011EE04EF|nr:hypothetical protein [Cyclobacterium marinum]MBI0401734.1 hypothetical protein [Cyclobacterium marinum]